MGGQKWGGVDLCPACSKNVYPTDRVYAADRKPFHRGCINCQVRGCRNELTAKDMHKHEGYNFCNFCHESYYDQRSYGPPAGGETIEERRLREAREAEERERRLAEMREQADSVSGKGFQGPYCMKIAETVQCL